MQFRIDIVSFYHIQFQFFNQPEGASEDDAARGALYATNVMVAHNAQGLGEYLMVLNVSAYILHPYSCCTSMVCWCGPSSYQRSQ